MSKDNLKKFAADLNLNTDQFNECLDTEKYAETVQMDTNGARQLGATSTPVFIINGQPVIGAQPFEIFQQAIDQLLAAND